MQDKQRTRAESRKKKRSVFGGFHATLLLVCCLSLLLVGPLRGYVFPVVPGVLVLASFALFFAPGAALDDLLPRSARFGLPRLSLTAPLSIGAFGVAALPVLLLHLSLEEYLLICAAVLVAALGLSLFFRVRRGRYTGDEGSEETSAGAGGTGAAWATGLLWVPFLVFAGALAYVARLKIPTPSADGWIYMAYVREYLERGEIGLRYPFTDGEVPEFSRLIVDGWLVEQAALSRISGVDPIQLVHGYLAPALIVASLLAIYALGKVVFGSERAALLAGSLSALFFLYYLHTPAGDEFVGFITEDKYVARSIFLPAALSTAVVYLRGRKLLQLAYFAFFCWSVVAVHPIGVIIIGSSVAGFGLVYLFFHLKDKGAWLAVGGMWGAVLAVAIPPVVYLLAIGSPLLDKAESTPSTVSTSLVAYAQYQGRLLGLGEDSYMLHPSLLLIPPFLAAYALGIPFLIWRSRESIAAQMLLGTLLFVPVLVFVPPVATALGDALGPWILPRLAWPVFPAALLTVTWMIWSALEFLRTRLPGAGQRGVRGLGALLPLVLVLALAIGVAPWAADAIRSADRSGEIAQAEPTCQDPVFGWVRDNVDQASVILAPINESSCLPAYSSRANVFGLRESAISNENDDRRGIQEVFAQSDVLDERMRKTLVERKEKAGHVLLAMNSPLNAQLEHTPGFTELEVPGDRYRLFEVTAEELRTTPELEANNYLNDENLDAAIEAHTAALEQSGGESFLSYLGLGRTYALKGMLPEAISNYEEAASLEPESPAVHETLAELHSLQGELEPARAAFERVVRLAPENMAPRQKFGTFLLLTGQEGALDQFRAVVEAYPRVPGYRVKLGEALYRSGEPGAAKEEFDRAVALDPLSSRVHVSVGDAYLNLEDLEAAAGAYEMAVELNPRDQPNTFRLGRIYTRLSTRNGGRDERYFGLAEETLQRTAEELEPEPRTKDLSGSAQAALGDLYLAWDRKDEAIAAYEQALEINPNTEKIKEKLERAQNAR